MTTAALKKIDHKNQMLCQHCLQHFHYDQLRHCWMCDSVTCSYCASAENICPDCRTRVLHENIEPMLSKLKSSLPSDSQNWAYEFKWDGIRAISYWNGRKLTIESRNLLNITFRYPELKDIGSVLQENAIVDGEIVALDQNNRPSFPLLQRRMHISPSKVLSALPKMQIRYYLFDILFLNGQNLMDLPYHQRRRMLENLNIKHPFLQVPPNCSGDCSNMIKTAKKFKLEGVICKKLDSPYIPALRTDNWLKIKFTNSREFLIGGFKYSPQTTSRIASLQLGAYDNDYNLRFVGSVGTGFTDEDHKFLLSKLEPLKIDKSSFADRTESRTVFIKPVLIAQVEYRRWPKGNLVQQASFKGLRTDKHPSEIKLKEQ
jgi:bifunctional non-homologous end joining protein LigD